MAKKEVKIKLSTTGKNKTEQDIKGVNKTIGLLAKSALTLAAAYKVAGFALESVKLAGRLRDLETAHKNLSKAQGLNAKVMIDQMQKATRGTVSELDLLKQANNALLLGLPVTEQDMGKLADAGRRLGRAMGIDAAMGLESLVVGIGRQSKLWLDNLGILIDVEKAHKIHAASLGKQASQLTDAEKKLSFYNATMASVSEKMKTLGEDQETVTDALERAAVAYENVKIEAGKLIATPVAESLSFTERAAKLLNLSLGTKGLWGTIKGIFNPIKAVTDLAIAQAMATNAAAIEQHNLNIEMAKTGEIAAATTQGVTLEDLERHIELTRFNLKLAKDKAKIDERIARNIMSQRKETEKIIPASKEIIKLKKFESGFTEEQLKNQIALTNYSKVFIQQASRGVELFKGMDKFGKSLLNSVQRTAEQLAGKAFTAFLMSFIPGSGGFVSSFKGLLGFQHGGPVEANQPIIVGEKRPEVFIPDRAGTILPEVGGNKLTVNLYGVFHGSIDELADEIASRSDQGFNRVAVNA